MKIKRFWSLKTKMFFVLLTAFVASVSLYLFLNFCVDSGIQNFYLSKDVSDRRASKYVQSFEDYITANEVQSTDLNKISTWTEQNHYIYLMIYDSGNIIYDEGAEEIDKNSDYSEDPSPDAPILTEEQYEEYGQILYPVQFPNTIATVAVLDSSEAPLYAVGRMLSLLLSVVCFVVIILVYNRRMTSSIITLAREVGVVEKGDLQHAIAIDRNDEISVLASNVDAMRCSIIEKLQAEKKAWGANYDLITAMSHDIRTPLTALLGYIDLIESGKYQSKEQYDKYITASKNKALQLKELSDKLFQYFLIFGKPNLSLETVKVDAAILLQQIIGEHMIYLQNQGFDLIADLPEKSREIQTDINYVRRLFDNVFSNVQKYADSSYAVEIEAVFLQDQLRFTMQNYVSKKDGKMESTKIGLQTCTKIASQLGGSFDYTQKKNKFRISLSLPLLKDHSTYDSCDHSHTEE